MVTDEERDVLYRAYAPEPGMRRNVGIGRRLFPLLDDDRRQAELLHSLLLSLPGSPFLYYGDEIGMGERLELGDRDPVRTPMQWDGSANGGFSSAPADQLYLPSIEDGEYGFHQRNVELEREDRSSFMWWLRDLLSCRRERRAFSVGSFETIKTGHESVFGYVRSDGGDHVLCVANFSDQPVETGLEGQFAARDRITGSIGAVVEGCHVTLDGYGWAWLNLDEQASRPPTAGC